jgi:exopolysaccharide biosynthesis polyprenyl glycosylphosphotransferase
MTVNRWTWARERDSVSAESVVTAVKDDPPAELSKRGPMEGHELVMPAAAAVPGRARSERRDVPPHARARSAAGATVQAVAAKSGTATREVSHDRRYRHATAFADVAAAAGALFVALASVGAGSVAPGAVLALPLVVVVGKLQGLYDRDELLMRKTTLDEAPKLFERAVLCSLLLWLADGLVLITPAGKGEVLIFLVASFLFSLAGRSVARTTVRAATPAERCLFIGDASSFDRLRAKLEAAGAPVTIVGRMSLYRPHPMQGSGRQVGADELREFIRWTGAHRVIIESQALPAEEMLDFIRCAKSVDVRVSLVPRVLDVVGTAVVFDDLHGTTVLGVRRFGLTRSSWMLKRAFDLTGAALALLVSAPALVLIALAIKLDSRGPVLFRQTRVGRGGRRFAICKFRTMVLDAEERKSELADVNGCQGGLFKLENDPRITRVGRFLRKTSLDELPQLLNVLSGDMSLVGPRPLIVHEDEQITGWDRRRLQLTPGMTGHWQILGSARVPLAEMVKIDYLYIAGWSLWTDVKIILRTVPYMLSRRGM